MNKPSKSRSIHAVLIRYMEAITSSMMSVTTDNASSQNMQAANCTYRYTVQSAPHVSATSRPDLAAVSFKCTQCSEDIPPHAKSRTVNEAVWRSDGDNSTFKVEDKAMTLENDSGLMSRLLCTA